jgi:hypothetical protein
VRLGSFRRLCYEWKNNQFGLLFPNLNYKQITTPLHCYEHGKKLLIFLPWCAAPGEGASPRSERDPVLRCSCLLLQFFRLPLSDVRDSPAETGIFKQTRTRSKIKYGKYTSGAEYQQSWMSARDNLHTTDKIS